MALLPGFFQGEFQRWIPPFFVQSTYAKQQYPVSRGLAQRRAPG